MIRFAVLLARERIHIPTELMEMIDRAPCSSHHVGHAPCPSTQEWVAAFTARPSVCMHQDHTHFFQVTI